MTLARSPRALPVLIGSAVAIAATCLVVAGVAAARSPLPSPLLMGVCLVMLFAGVRFRLSIRLGSEQVELSWSEAAFVLALAVAPAPWVVLLTPIAVGVNFAQRRFAPVKTIYNVAIFTAAAGSAAGVLALAAVTRPFAEPELLVLGAAGVLAGLVTYLAVAAVVAIAQDVPLLATWRAAAGLQLLTLAGNLSVAVGVVFLIPYGPLAVTALPVVALCLHQAYEGKMRGRQEREAGQQHAAAVGRLTEDLDEPGVLRRAAKDACALADVDAVDVELPAHGDTPARLYRHSRRGPAWTGDSDAAPSLPARIVAELPVPTDDGSPPGQLRAWLIGGAPDLPLGQFKESALRSLAEHAGAAVRNARIHALQTYHATHDRLTGLPDRPVLFDRIHHSAVTQSQHGLTPVALILVDLSGYRDIVRSLGHDTAEHLLVRTADQLRDTVTGGEYLAHVGGDDFGVYLHDAHDPEHVRTRAGALLKAVAAPYRIDAGTVQLDAVAGVAYSGIAVLSGAELLRQATFALDHARDENVPIQFYDPGADLLGGPAAVVLASELHTALEFNQMHLEYQPIVAVPSQAPIAVEALLRWQHPTRGMLYPPQFMAVLERSADHGRFVEWQLDQALRAREAWGNDRDLPVSVNIAFRCLLSRSFPTQVEAALHRAGVAGDQLMFELADTDSLTGSFPVLEVLTKLRHLGVRIAIDKFGTGVTSLTGLLKLPATHVKIDSEFVQNAIDSEQVAVIGLAVELARHSNLQVTAIGVPSDEHIDALVKLGCDAGQGGHLAPPMSIRLLRDYLDTAPIAPPAPDADVIKLDSRRRSGPTN